MTPGRTEDAKLQRAGFQKLGPQKLWCQICDSRQVDSARPDTGKFFRVFGIELTAEERYVSSFFAVCDQCNVMNAVKEIPNVENLLVRSLSDEHKSQDSCG